MNPQRIAYLVLNPPSVAWWFTMALLAERQQNLQLRDYALQRAAEITDERKTNHDTPNNA